MTEEGDLLTLAEDVCRRAVVAGADDADVLIGAGTEFSVTVRKQEVENLVEASSRAMGLRVIKGGRVAVSYSSDFSRDALEQFVDETIERASISDVDEAAGLPDDGYGQIDPATLDLFDPDIQDMDGDRAIALARQCEQAGFDADSRISNSGGAGYGYNTGMRVLVNSRGFAGSSRGSGCSLSVELMADDVDGKKQNDYWYTSDRFYKNLEEPEFVGRKAAERAVRKLGARKVPTREVAVVWDPMVSRTLVGLLARSASGELLYRRSSFLLDLEGQQIASPLLTITDDPLLPGKLGTRTFDGEGLISLRNELFREGTFVQFLLDTYTARKTNRTSTHSAVRGVGGTPSVGTSNLLLKPGTSTPEEIIANVDDGLYLTELMGFGDNLTTGDFSRGAAGLWIEHGQLTYPVSEINVSGNLKDMIRDVEMTGNDIDFRSTTVAPTILMRKLMVSGL
jgi:PmbA protein